MRTLAHSHHHSVERSSLRICTLLLALRISPHCWIAHRISHHHLRNFLRILTLHNKRLTELHLWRELLLHNHTWHTTHRETSHWHHYHATHSRIHSHVWTRENHVWHHHLLLLRHASLRSSWLTIESHLRILNHSSSFHHLLVHSRLTRLALSKLALRCLSDFTTLNYILTHLLSLLLNLSCLRLRLNHTSLIVCNLLSVINNLRLLSSGLNI